MGYQGQTPAGNATLVYVDGYVADPFAYALGTLILFRVGKQRVATDLLGIHAEAG